MHIPNVVNLLDFVVNKIIGLEDISDEKKEKYLEIVVKAVAEGAAKGVAQSAAGKE